MSGAPQHRCTSTTGPSKHKPMHAVCLQCPLRINARQLPRKGPSTSLGGQQLACPTGEQRSALASSMRQVEIKNCRNPCYASLTGRFARRRRKFVRGLDLVTASVPSGS